MRILITNDDSISASQLIPLIRWCQKLGEVTTVVPKFEQSGKSHSIELHKAFEVKLNHPEPGIDIYTVDSSPADCVRYAVLGMHKKFDLVISGINKGFNMGSDMLYSGTMAAATEAVLLGVKAIALSTSPAYYDHAVTGKYTRDDESIEMIEIIMSRRIFDYGDTILCSWLRDGIFRTAFDSNNRDIMSSLASAESNVTERLNLLNGES